MLTLSECVDAIGCAVMAVFVVGFITFIGALIHIGK